MLTNVDHLFLGTADDFDSPLIAGAGQKGIIIAVILDRIFMAVDTGLDCPVDAF